MLQDRSKRRIAILGSRHVPVVSVHLVELVARSLAQEGHNLITSGAQGVNAAVIRSVLDVDPSRLTVLLPQSLDRQPTESRDQLERVLHLVELVARSLAQEGHNLITSGAQGVNAAVIRSVLDVDPSRLTVLLPQSLDRQPTESRDQLERVLHLVEKPEHDELPLPMASSLCNQEIISRCDQLICYAFHDSETLLASCRAAEDMGKVVSLMFFD